MHKHKWMINRNVVLEWSSVKPLGERELKHGFMDIG